MATPTQSLMDHLNDNWSATAISWQNYNSSFDPGGTRTGYTNNDLWIVPLVEQIESEWMNAIPQEVDTVRERYNLTVTVVSKQGSGTQKMEARIADLKTLYDRTTVTNEGNTLRFKEMMVLPGQLIDTIGPQTGLESVYFEMPVVVPFETARVDA